jgi:uncharacterized protein YbjT (DUF2867 family)
MPPGPILVTGATGRQGGAVVHHLSDRGASVRALTRNPQSRPARGLASQGIRVVNGDMDDLESLKRAMTGTHGVYSVQDAMLN